MYRKSIRQLRYQRKRDNWKALALECFKLLKEHESSISQGTLADYYAWRVRRDDMIAKIARLNHQNPRAIASGLTK